MGNVGVGESGHVTIDATIFRARLLANVSWKAATILPMAVQAAVPEILRSFLARGQYMGIVTGDATQLALARLKTAAGVHLFDLTDGPEVIGHLGRKHKDGAKLEQGQTGAKVEDLLAAPDYSTAELSLQMALLANRLAQGWVEAAGIDNRIVQALKNLTARAPVHVQFPWAVAAFTTNGKPPREKGLGIAVHRVGDGLEVVGVAKQAFRLDRPAGKQRFPKSR
jgi:hypothetical protein